LPASLKDKGQQAYAYPRSILGYPGRHESPLQLLREYRDARRQGRTNWHERSRELDESSARRRLSHAQPPSPLG